MTTYKICLLPGDGIGPEIIAEGVKVLDAVGKKYGVDFEYSEALLGGCAIDECGTALPDETLEAAKASDAVLLAAGAAPAAARGNRPADGGGVEQVAVPRTAGGDRARVEGKLVKAPARSGMRPAPC